MIVSPETLPRMSADQFLDYEPTQAVRHELVDGYLYAMVGASDRHEKIAMNLAAALQLQLRGGPRRVYKSDLKLRIDDDFYLRSVWYRAWGSVFQDRSGAYCRGALPDEPTS